MDITMQSISTIAREISREWKNVNYAAKPYLQAMYSLDSVKDSYYEDSAKSIVSYFLCNASGYRGEAAKAHKAALKLICGIK
jgi:replicative DNA helicase